MNGGGYGPFGNYVGLGFDNLLEVDIITGKGEALTINMVDGINNSDLALALRGGGGSVWGVVT